MTPALTRRSALLTGLALVRPNTTPARQALKVAIFSKHLQFLQGAELAHAVADLGFHAIDLTVRAGGHVDPARVAEDLPPLVSLIRQNKLDVSMITTDIVDAGSPYARSVLKTMSDLGIHYYRWGGFKYYSGQPLNEQFESLRQRSAQLAALNREYRVCAIYHTHSGVDLVGGPVWDIVHILTGLDPETVAINYDVGHATVEGGLGGWIDSFRLAEPYVRGVAFKDFVWQKQGGGKWELAWVPLGQGMVRFPLFCSMLAASSFNGPVQLHFEHSLGGAEAGKRQITIARDQLFSAMRRDLKQLCTYFDAAGLAHA
jgi:sugar phosphate isomerase/epimerase